MTSRTNTCDELFMWLFDRVIKNEKSTLRIYAKKSYDNNDIFVKISTDSFKTKFKPKDLMQFNLAVGEINELQCV